jgi:hypothetical protein
VCGDAEPETHAKEVTTMRRVTAIVLAVGLSGGAPLGFAQEATPTAYPQRAPEEKAAQPPADHPAASGGGAVATLPPPRTGPRSPSLPETVDAKGSAELASPSQSSVGAGVLKDLRALRLKEGEAQVRIGTQVRTLRPGDRIGTDVVRRIEDTQIVLSRPEGNGAESRVVIDFDGAGVARVRIFMTQDRSLEK